MKYFGTDGYRGRPYYQLPLIHVFLIGVFLAQKGKKVLIARDPRASGELLEDILKTGLILQGAEVSLLGIAPTPAVSYLAPHYDFSCVLSASHNPYFDNGIKIFNQQGGKISGELEQAIEDYLDSNPQPTFPATAGQVIDAASLLDRYLNFLRVDINGENLPFLVVDCAHGATSFLAPRLLKRLKVQHQIINHQPDGYNINHQCGSTYIEHLTVADDQLLCSLDGDGDRLLLKYQGQVLTGDHLLYLLSKHLTNQGRLKGTVVTTIMANSGLIKSLKRDGIKTLITDVGDRHVSRVIQEQGLVLGGEQSGHIIIADRLKSGDGLLTLTELLSFLTTTSLKEALSGLTLFPQQLVNLEIKDQERVMRNKELLKELTADQKLLGDSGRILIRPSGTQQMIRLMVEAEDQLLLPSLIKKYRQLILTADQ